MIVPLTSPASEFHWTRSPTLKCTAICVLLADAIVSILLNYTFDTYFSTCESMMVTELPPIFTIGHSTRSIAQFVALLQVGSVGMVVDIRKIPRSRTNPQLNIDTLPEALSAWQIDYSHIEE